MSEIHDLVAKRLGDADVIEKITDIFSTYYDDAAEIVAIATVESGGIRPDGLTNEIYSCFHHISRALCIQEADSIKELNSANCSHLKRLILDSYKIAINSYLEEDNRLKNTLDYLVLSEDFTRYIPDGLTKVNDISDTSRLVKKYYFDARKAELRGRFSEAIDNLKKALEACADLRDKIKSFTDNQVYILACAREQKRIKEKRTDRVWHLVVTVISVVLTAIFTFMITVLLNKNKHEILHPADIAVVRSAKVVTD